MTEKDHSQPRIDGWGARETTRIQFPSGHTLIVYDLPDGLTGFKGALCGPGGLHIRSFTRDTVEQLKAACLDIIDKEQR